MCAPTWGVQPSLSLLCSLYMTLDTLCFLLSLFHGFSPTVFFHSFV